MASILVGSYDGLAVQWMTACTLMGWRVVSEIVTNALVSGILIKVADDVVNTHSDPLSSAETEAIESE